MKKPRPHRNLPARVTRPEPAPELFGPDDVDEALDEIGAELGAVFEQHIEEIEELKARVRDLETREATILARAETAATAAAAHVIADLARRIGQLEAK